MFDWSAGRDAPAPFDLVGRCAGIAILRDVRLPDGFIKVIAV